ncbi:iron-siderophore ABC transporter substrate-binding protein [Geminocystis herdmanii]|uniref:iron-siderophore ABC transporter substrate-binding protein n=1 Tax=Geminocystis herdmanii TaxID=669359 RepID=UPI0003479409|nr:iron-siderophore ABC transporter substrate-binding protein [Geminocystis herdmanii]
MISCNKNIEISNSNNNNDNDNCREVSHKIGKTKVCGEPKRIIALGPNVLEHLLALEIQPVAFADQVNFSSQDYTNPVQQIPYLGKYLNESMTNVGLAYSPNLESILKMKPDLILGIESNNAQQYKTLSKIAPTVLVNWADGEESMRAIAQAFNSEMEAEKVLQTTKAKITEAKTEFTPIVEKYPKVLLLRATGVQEFVSDNSRGLCSSLVKDLGFELVSPQKSNSSPSDSFTTISLEVLPQLEEADLIILLGYDFTQLETLTDMNNFGQHQVTKLQKEWSKNEIAQSLSASKEGKVYYIPAYLCFGLTGAIGTELYLNELKKQLLPTL